MNNLTRTAEIHAAVASPNPFDLAQMHAGGALLHLGDYALGDGSDDSQAFADALATGRPLYIPQGHHFVLGDVRLPDDAVLYSPALQCYQLPFDTPAMLTAADGARCIFDTSGSSGVRMQGLSLDGNGRRADGITGSGQNINLRELSIRNCNIALGGYWNHAELSDCHLSRSNYGIKDLISSTVRGGSVNHNHCGVHMGIGASDNCFIGVRTEWNRDNNYVLYRNAANRMIGGCIDRAGQCGIHATECELTLSAVQLRRNGHMTADGVHLLCRDIRTLIMQGVVTSLGVPERSQDSYDSPASTLRFEGDNGNVMLSGNDLTGCRYQPVVGQSRISNLSQAANIGL